MFFVSGGLPGTKAEQGKGGLFAEVLYQGQALPAMLFVAGDVADQQPETMVPVNQRGNHHRLLLMGLKTQGQVLFRGEIPGGQHHRLVAFKGLPQAFMGAGEGLTPPLLKLTMERSTVKACWANRQKSSSRAMVSGSPDLAAS